MNDKIFCENSTGLLILAGGRSLRMGRDKASLDIEGKSFAEHIAAAMGDYAEYILSSGGGLRLDGFVTVADEEELKDRGPAAGIISALEFCRSRRLVTVPCDTPLVDREVALRLWERAERQARPRPVVAESRRGLEPLIGIYPKDFAAAMRNAVLQDVKKVRDILERAGYDSVKIDEDKLVNINDPNDYERFREKYGKR